MTSVTLTDVSLDYPVYELTGRSLKVSVLRQVAGARLVMSGGAANVCALSHISMSLKEGDRLGLVGHNGSGKSTLLRVIAGVAHPQRGKVETVGRVIPLIDRAMGINPDLSGLENIELPLRLMGATSAEVAHAKKEIPEWTGLGQFMNLPVRTYSDGMRARLSFALCTAVPGDILVLDEWLSAGDAGFIEQARARIADYVSRSKILILASHSNEMIEQACNVTAWMERGEVRAIGATADILPLYVEAMHQSAVAGQASEFV